MKTAGFHGEGYVELNSRRLRKTATVGFTFKTAAPSGLLMLSTFATKVGPVGRWAGCGEMVDDWRASC